MSATRYRNPRTGACWAIDTALSVAPDDQGYLDLTPGDGLTPDMIDTGAIGLWRYSAGIRLPAAAPVVSLGEGWTPLLKRSWRDTPIAIKCEHMMPTGSTVDDVRDGTRAQLGLSAPGLGGVPDGLLTAVRATPVLSSTATRTPILTSQSPAGQLTVAGGYPADSSATVVCRP